MQVELRITSGSRAGQRELFTKLVISIGRHPRNDLRFDPERDADASSRHAEIRVRGDTATLRDLDSTNGTFVNGQRIAAATVLRDGDLLSFGREGPAVEFRAVAGRAPAREGRDTASRIAKAVREHTGALRRLVIALGVLAVAGTGAAYWIGHRDSVRARAKVDALLRRNDSLSAAFEKTVGSMRGHVAALDSALAESKRETDLIRSRVAEQRRKGGRANLEDLSARLDVAERRQRALVSAGAVDYESIAARDGPAIVFIAVREANGESVNASGFNVAPSGLIVTNRHVVQDSLGRPARSVAVIFDGTRGEWKKAHVLKVSSTDELAFLKVEDPGTYAVVAGVTRRSSVRVGTPVALMGYPLGTGTAGMGGDLDVLRPRSTLGLGTVSKSLADTLQFDAYAAPGSSGSAVFDARGFVVGVLFGGLPQSEGRIVYAVPSGKLAAQMPPEGSAIIR